MSAVRLASGVGHNGSLTKWSSDARRIRINTSCTTSRCAPVWLCVVIPILRSGSLSLFPRRSDTCNAPCTERSARAKLSDAISIVISSLLFDSTRYSASKAACQQGGTYSRYSCPDLDAVSAAWTDEAHGAGRELDKTP